MLFASIANSELNLPILADLVAWWDASDSSTITHSSGSVSQITDKSGNGHTLTQGTSTAQPKINTETLNGLPVLDFDGGDWLAASSGTIGKNCTGMTAFIVMKLDTDVLQIPFGVCTNGNSDRRFDLDQYLNKSWWIFRRTDGGSEFYNTSERNPYNVYRVFVGRIDFGTTGGPTRQFWGRRLEVANNSGATGTTSNTDCGRISLGREAWRQDYPIDGKIAEVVVYNASLSDANVEEVTRYLERKWGLSGTAAGNIAWSEPEVISTSDLSCLDTQSNQTLEYGWVFTATTGTVGGISFTQASCDNETANAGGLSFSHSNSTLASLLSTCEYRYDSGNPVNMQLTLTGLTSGTMYEVQLFQVDTRTTQSARLGWFADNNGNESKAFRHGDAVSVKGRFVASGTSQVVFVNANAGGEIAASTLNMAILRRFN